MFSELQLNHFDLRCTDVIICEVAPVLTERNYKTLSVVLQTDYWTTRPLHISEVWLHTFCFPEVLWVFLPNNTCKNLSLKFKTQIYYVTNSYKNPPHVKYFHLQFLCSQHTIMYWYTQPLKVNFHPPSAFWAMHVSSSWWPGNNLFQDDDQRDILFHLNNVYMGQDKLEYVHGDRTGNIAEVYTGESEMPGRGKHNTGV